MSAGPETEDTPAPEFKTTKKERTAKSIDKQQPPQPPTAKAAPEPEVKGLDEETVDIEMIKLVSKVCARRVFYIFLHWFF